MKRTVKIGECTVVFDDVPDGISEERLKNLAKKAITKINIEKAKRLIQHDFQKAYA